MPAKAKEFKYTEENFKFISELAYKHTGIVLAEHKKDMTYSRLTRRIRALGLKDYDAYCDYLKENEDKELKEFTNALTTNLTSFFREDHHFDFLKEQQVSALKQQHAGDKRIRIWSAGCSSGMEPYSIAMSLFDAFPLRTWDLKILATDLDSDILEKGKRGIYHQTDTEEIPKPYLQEHFDHDRSSQQVRVKQHIRDLVHFKQLNLLQPWPMKGPFDIIFCRNVVIYFDQPTKRLLFDRYAEILKSDGILILGHSESLQNLTKRFKAIGRTIFQRIE